MDDSPKLNAHLLIRMVRSHPEIWNRRHDYYKDRKMTRNGWREVCESLNDQFKNFDEVEKEKYYKSVIKKWTNLRDGHLRAQKRMRAAVTSGAPATKKYVYGDEFDFISTDDSNNNNNDVNSAIKIENATTTASSTTDNTTTNTDNKNTATVATATSSKTDNTKHNINNKSSSEFPGQNLVNNVQENIVLNTFEVSPIENIDVEDIVTWDKQKNLQDLDKRYTISSISTVRSRHTAFFESIIPSLESLTEDEVIEYQAGVLQILIELKKKRALTMSDGIY